jgi:hypothetical protein
MMQHAVTAASLCTALITSCSTASLAPTPHPLLTQSTAALPPPHATTTTTHHHTHSTPLYTGYMPRKFDAQEPASYGRLVNHLQRLWQYEACDEAVLKVWLAHHLLARENTGACVGLQCGRRDVLCQHDMTVMSSLSPESQQGQWWWGGCLRCM